MYQTIVVMMLVIGVLTMGCTSAQEIPEPIDLSGAVALGHPQSAPQLIDGSERRVWNSGRQDLSEMALNLFIVLSEPELVGLMEVVIPQHDEPDLHPPRIGNMEIYARVGDEWAMIGEIRDNEEQPRIWVDLIPAEVDVVRLRVLPRRESHPQWAMISQVRLYPPAQGVEAQELVPTPIPESESEAIWVREIMNPPSSGPTVSFDPEKGYLGYVRSWFEAMAEDGTDRYGEVHSPMFTSILDLETRTHPRATTHPNMEIPTIYGQRAHDRADMGGNLQHDAMAIMAAHYVTEITGDERYRQIARDYVQFFLDNCTDTPTGLWPWGEHAYWDFFENGLGREQHHLLCKPLDFYELAYELNPDAVIGLCDGLINHVTDLETFMYNRHADVTVVLPDPRPEGLAALDFANSGSRYLRLWAYAYSTTGDEKYLDWCNNLLDHLEWSRVDGDGALPGLSLRTTDTRGYHGPSYANTMLVGVSLLEYAPLLGDTATAERFRELGEEFLALVAERSLPDPDRQPIFHNGRGMGGGKAHWAHVYRVTGNEYFLEAARNIAAPYLHLQEMPDIPMKVQSFAVPIDLMMDMYELDGDAAYLEAAERYARIAIETLYYNGLFRATPDTWYQDSHTGTATLVYALVRLHAAVEGLDIEVPPNVYQF